jgi:hypothetical protein
MGQEEPFQLQRLSDREGAVSGRSAARGAPTEADAKDVWGLTLVWFKK